MAGRTPDPPPALRALLWGMLLLRVPVALVAASRLPRRSGLNHHLGRTSTTVSAATSRRKREATTPFTEKLANLFVPDCPVEVCRSMLSFKIPVHVVRKSLTSPLL